MLNCRIEEGVNPIRVICDTNLDIDLNSNIVNTAKEIRTINIYYLPISVDWVWWRAGSLAGPCSQPLERWLLAGVVFI